MNVYRTLPLPRGELRGKYQFTVDIIDLTQRALTVFFEAGRHEGGHEGICYWAGRESFSMTYFDAVLHVRARHGKFGVFVTERDFADVARRARSMGLGILAQVHSHPGWDTRHSDGDDELIVLPFENMLSLVAPFYGQTLYAITDFSVHQYQDHRWVLCDPKSVLSAFDTL